MKAERKLEKVVIDLIRSELFIDMSGIIMMGKKQVVSDIPTAMTNGRDELYGSAFVDSLNMKELAFVVVHEAYHKMMRDMNTWVSLWKESPQIANMAMDHVNNLAILARDPGESVVAMPKLNGKPMGLADPRFKGMHAKQVFDILKKEMPPQGQGQGQPGQGQGQGQGNGQGGGLDEHDWKGAQGLSKEEKDQLVKDIDQAIRQGQITAQKMHGKGAGDMDRTLHDLLYPKVDWRELLRDFVSAVCKGMDYSSWRKPNRRFLSQDIIMPSMIAERVKCIVIGCDTSGSITAADHQRNLSETQAILNGVNPEEVHIIYWDTHVAGHEVYDEATISSFAESTKPKGGGGTDPSCMSDYMKQHGIKPDCIIQFTDGYVPNWGDWDAPILWCVVGNPSATAPMGKTIHVEN